MTEICAHMCECIWMRVFCGGEEQLTVPFFYFFGHPKITITQSFDTVDCVTVVNTFNSVYVFI